MPNAIRNLDDIRVATTSNQQLIRRLDIEELDL
jgi:hypothetical protein